MMSNRTSLILMLLKLYVALKVPLGMFFINSCRNEGLIGLD